MSDTRRNSMCFFSLFSGWFLAVAFQGPVLLGRMEDVGFIVPEFFIACIVFAHFVGLIGAGSFIKPPTNFKRTMTISLMVCLIGNTFLFLPFTAVWVPAMVTTSFFAGFVIAGWGHYYKTLTPSGEKLATAATVIVFANVIMVVLIAISIIVSSLVGLFVSSAFLLASCVIFFKRMPTVEGSIKAKRKAKAVDTDVTGPLVLLYAFVTLLSINSGLMYHIINPAFAQHKMLVNVYWALPYIVMVYLITRLPERFNKSYILYAAIMMIGVAYILYFILDRSALSYILINTLLLGAFGVCDLFWWTVLGEALAFSENPVKTFGVGLSANVLGILAGMLIGRFLLIFADTNIKPMTVAVGIVFLTLLSLPMLYSRLSLVIDNKGFLVGLSRATGKAPVKRPVRRQGDVDVIAFLKAEGLTDREVEIAAMLCRGLTYKVIAQELKISENTVKSHVKNVYSKLGVRSKSELIKMVPD